MGRVSGRAGAGAATRGGRWSALLDTVMVATAIASALFLTLRPIAIERSDWVNDTNTRAAVYGGAALLVVLGTLLARRLRSTGKRIGARAPVLLITGVLGVLAFARVREDTAWHWPPRTLDSMSARTGDLWPRRRAEWAAQVVMHRLSTRPDDSVLTIPEDWPLPPDVQVAVTRDGGVVRVWGRTQDGMTRCVANPAEGPGHAPPRPPRQPAPPVAVAASGASETGCAPGVAVPDSAQFAWPQRTNAETPQAVLARVGDPWTQYRGDAEKTAMPGADEGTPAWSAAIDGEVRASFSIVGDLALLGAHGTGTLTAFDRRTGAVRWTRRVPNWIHQDAVSDGSIVVVGFGDNNLGFLGRSPSGVAAFAASDGQHLWTRFDETSTMTSGIVRDSVIVYATSAGMLRKRSLRHGTLLRELQLPGGVVMGPPAAVGDTLVVSLDLGGVCALRYSTLEKLWCRETPYQIEMGHSAPTVKNGVVITTGIILGQALTLGELASLPGAVQSQIARDAIMRRKAMAGQRFQAFRLSDGTPLWKSRVFPSTRVIEGHPSGTAAVADSVGVIVLPLADTIVGFNMRSGQVIWTAGAHGSRGPPLVLGGTAVNAGRDGTTDVRDAVSGQLRCTMSRKVGYDRAGPTPAGGLLLFADLKGGVEAVRASDLLSCNPAATTAATRAASR